MTNKTPPAEPSSSEASVKAQLRRELRAQRSALSESQRLQAGKAIDLQAQTLARWNSSSSIALYLSSNNEIDTGPLIASARAQHKTLYLPRVDDKGQMRFAHWQPHRPLIINRYGIPEPEACARTLTADELDIIFLPLLGWTKEGLRLGMGGGYYDRALSNSQSLRVGLAFDCQQRAQLPSESWDIRLHWVVTEVTTYRCQKD